MTYTYEYPRPAVTVDCFITRKINNKQELLLVRRKDEPFKEAWALPGGFCDIDERLKAAAARELEEETGVKDVELSQLYTFDKIDRDPRHRTISTVFTGFVADPDIHIRANSDAMEVKWHPLDALPTLAFDHDDVVELVTKGKRPADS